MVNLDFSSVPDRTPIPEGIYTVTIDKVEASETGPNSKSPGSPMLVMQYREEETGKMLFNNLMCTGPGAFMLRNLLEVLGYTAEEMVDFEESELVGQVVKVKVTQEENTYNGDTSIVNVIKKFYAA